MIWLTLSLLQENIQVELGCYIIVDSMEAIIGRDVILQSPEK